MSLTKAQKGDLIKDLTAQIKGAKSVVFADYQGLSVKDIKNLRKQLREKGIKYQVAKKTLIKIAAKEAGYSDIPKDILEGPVGAAFASENETAAAKIIYQFAKKNTNLKLRGAFFEGRVLSLAETKQLAMLPSKEELIAKLLYLIKYPIQGFHGVLYGTLAGFVRALKAIGDKKAQA